MSRLRPGIHQTTLTFASSALRGWEWPCIEIVGKPGPRLAVYAGMHINEVSSIEAAIRLASAFDPTTLQGRVSILPVLNLPAWDLNHRFVCPLDGKNINFCFPGDPHGSFSEVLADALLNEWADDAECLVDLHGGDFGEEVARFNVVQRTGDEVFDRRALEVAQLFDAQFVTALGPEYLEEPGRSVTGRARQRRLGAFAEAGMGGVVDERSVRFHADGVLRLASHFGLVEKRHAPARAGDAPIVLSGYAWIRASRRGWCRMLVKPGERVEAGQAVARIVDLYGEVLDEIRAQESGWILWTATTPVVTESQHVGGIGHGPLERH